MSPRRRQPDTPHKKKIINEMAVYRRSPETFFGVMAQAPKGIKHPQDEFDFVYAALFQILARKAASNSWLTNRTSMFYAVSSANAI